MCKVDFSSVGMQARASRGWRGTCAGLSLGLLDHIVAESSVVLPAWAKFNARTNSIKCFKSPFGSTKSTHKFPANLSLTELGRTVPMGLARLDSCALV
jgi:hypothetical protein